VDPGIWEQFCCITVAQHTSSLLLLRQLRLHWPISTLKPFIYRSLTSLVVVCHDWLDLFCLGGVPQSFLCLLCNYYMADVDIALSCQ